VKMTPEHFEHLKKEVDIIMKEHKELRELYETGDFPRSESTKDLQMRFCFDIFWAVNLKDNHEFSGELYKYLNDTHIYTALRATCPKIVRRY